MPVTRPQSILQQVTFTTRQWYKTGNPPYFTCLMDAGGFSLTGGIQKINIVDRPKTVGLPVFAGFDPYTATVPLLVMGPALQKGAVSSADTEPPPYNTLVVDHIYSILLWMAGRGGPRAGVQPLVNQSPNNIANIGPVGIQVKTVNANGQVTSLVPNEHQNNITWMVTGLERGNEMLNNAGDRILQHLTVTLTQFWGAENAGTATARFGTKISWHKYKVVNTKRNTALSIVQQYMKVPKANEKPTAQAIIKYSGNKKLKLKSTTQKIAKVSNGKIKNPVELWIPSTAIVTP